MVASNKQLLPLIQQDETELRSRRCWTSLDYLHSEYRLHYGAILSDGSFERAIGTIYYSRRGERVRMIHV